MFQSGMTHGSFVVVKPECHLSAAKMNKGDEKKMTGVTVTVNVKSVDETLGKVVKEGGEVYK
jgi:predicted enzyme related to lactoylglutathione lyase